MMIKMDELKKEFMKKKVDLQNWASENKEIIALITPFIIANGLELSKILLKRDNLHMEKKLRDRYVYDYVTGHYWELKRKPSSEEWIQYGHRIAYHRHEPWEALSEMRLLKNVKNIKKEDIE